MINNRHNARGATGSCNFVPLALFVLALCFSPLMAMADEPKDSDKQSNGRFTGLAFITDDVLWYQQFEKPETPRISGKSHVLPGERAALAILFSNAEAADGVVKVKCTLTAIEPSGEAKTVADTVCYEGSPQPDNTLYPSLLDVQFEVSESDPRGIAQFEIVLEDINSERSVSLNVSFYQGHKDAV